MSGRKSIGFPVVDALVVVKGRDGWGARVRDVDGRAYIDLWSAHYSAILGHRPAFLAQAMARVVDEGTRFGIPSENEVLAATSKVRARGPQHTPLVTLKRRSGPWVEPRRRLWQKCARGSSPAPVEQMILESRTGIHVGMASPRNAPQDVARASEIVYPVTL